MTHGAMIFTVQRTGYDPGNVCDNDTSGQKQVKVLQLSAKKTSSNASLNKTLPRYNGGIR
jgi:hypothetical protein